MHWEAESLRSLLHVGCGVGLHVCEERLSHSDSAKLALVPMSEPATVVVQYMRQELRLSPWSSGTVLSPALVSCIHYADAKASKARKASYITPNLEFDMFKLFRGSRP